MPRSFAPVLALALVLASASPAAAAKPTTETFELTEPFATVLTDCGAELVAIVATIQITLRLTLQHTFVFDSRLHARTTGTGVGIPSLRSYKLLGQEHISTELIPGVDVHLIFDQKLIGSGGVPNSHLFTRIRLKITADGTPTVEHERSGCRISG